MLDVPALLDRPGLDCETRAMVIAKAAVWPGDWARLEAVLTQARERGLRRVLFEETLLQGVLFFGFPRSVTAFGVLAKVWPSDTHPTGGAVPQGDQAEAGRTLFDEIYGKNKDSVHAMLMSFHAEFHDFVIESAYGRILSRPGLDPRRRELLAASSLAIMDQRPQFVAHARGALHFGADSETLRETLVTVIDCDQRVSELMQRV